jgi:hypothetical protein
VWNGIAARSSANATTSTTARRTNVFAGWSCGRLADRASAPIPRHPPSATKAKCLVAASTERLRCTWKVKEPTGTRRPRTRRPKIASGAVRTSTPSAVAPTASAVGKKL